MKQIVINTYLIKEFAESGRLKELATFLYLKTRHKNGCYYNYSVRSLSRKSGLSNTAIKKYVDRFLKNGWCRMHAGNLIFTNLNNLTECKTKNRFAVSITNNIKEIVCDLRLLLLKQKQEQYRYVEKMAAEYLNPQNIKLHKKALKFFGCKKVKNIGKPNLALSMRSIANILSCSLTEASRTVSYLFDKRKIDVSRYKAIALVKIKPSHFFNNLDLFPECYFYKGRIVKQKCNEYVF